MSQNLKRKRKQMEQLLSKWFQANGRDFPWRNTKNPYHILIAEMLLRRTTATAVLRIYPGFIRRYNEPVSFTCQTILYCQAMSRLYQATRINVNKWDKPIFCFRINCHPIYKKIDILTHSAAIFVVVSREKAVPGEMKLIECCAHFSVENQSAQRASSMKSGEYCFSVKDSILMGSCICPVSNSPISTIVPCH